MKSPARTLAVLAMYIAFGETARAQETITNALGMVFVRIPAGEFVMGTEDLAPARWRSRSPRRRILPIRPQHTGWSSPDPSTSPRPGSPRGCGRR